MKGDDWKFRDFIHSFDEMQPGDRVLFVACESARDRRDNLDDQLANLRGVKPRGVIIVGRKRYIGKRYKASWIKNVVAFANRKRADWILAETSDRFARNPAFHFYENPDAQATPELLRRLQKLSGDRLMTHLDPDASASEIRTYQRRRGWKFSNNKGGPPKKTNYQPAYYQLFRTVDRVVRLRNRGKSWRDIAKKVGRSVSTIRGWYERETVNR